MAYLILGIVMIFLSIVFRLAAVFRLTIPLLYALVVPTVFHEWYYANQTLANVIWYVLLAVVVLSWVVSLVRKVRGILLRRREDKMLELRESHRIAGRPYMGQLSLTIAEVLPMVSDFLTVASFTVLMLTKLLLNSCSFTGLLNY